MRAGTARLRGQRRGADPVHRDPLAATPLALASVATLARPSSWTWFTDASVQNYA